MHRRRGVAMARAALCGKGFVCMGRPSKQGLIATGAVRYRMCRDMERTRQPEWDVPHLYTVKGPGRCMARTTGFGSPRLDNFSIRKSWPVHE